MITSIRMFRLGKYISVDSKGNVVVVKKHYDGRVKWDCSAGAARVTFNPNYAWTWGWLILDLVKLLADFVSCYGQRFKYSINFPTNTVLCAGDMTVITKNSNLVHYWDNIKSY